MFLGFDTLGGRVVTGNDCNGSRVNAEMISVSAFVKVSMLLIVSIGKDVSLYIFLLDKWLQNGTQIALISCPVLSYFYYLDTSNA